MDLVVNVVRSVCSQTERTCSTGLSGECEQTERTCSMDLVVNVNRQNVPVVWT